MRHLVAFVVFTHFVTCRLILHDRQWKAGDSRDNCTRICEDECIHCIEPIRCTSDQTSCGTERWKRHPDCPPNEVCVPDGCSCSQTEGKDGSDCPRLCEIVCKETEILCDGKYDTNECKEPDFCHPKGTGNGGILCPGFCPKECEENEIRCKTPNDPVTNCKVPPLCIPKQTSIGNPNHVCSVQQCPIVCDSSEKRCVGVIDNEGCKKPDICISECEACPLECDSGEILCKGTRDCNTTCQDIHQCKSKVVDINGEDCPDDSASHGCAIDCCKPDIVCPVATSVLGCKGKEGCTSRTTYIDIVDMGEKYCPVTSDCPTICKPNEVLCPVDGQDENGCENPDFCILQERDINSELCPVACPIECNENEVLCDGHINVVGCKKSDYCVRKEIRRWGTNKGTLCPGVCPPQCEHDEILCPSQLDPCDGCPTEEVCRPKHKNKNEEYCPDNSASHHCPKLCFENEVVDRGTNHQVLCPSYEDALGCRAEEQCFHRSVDGNSQYCPIHSVCPVQCLSNEIECPDGVDSRGCKREPICVPRGDDSDGNLCTGGCPPTCPELQRVCQSDPLPNGCPGYFFCQERGSTCEGNEPAEEAPGAEGGYTKYSGRCKSDNEFEFSGELKNTVYDNSYFSYEDSAIYYEYGGEADLSNLECLEWCKTKREEVSTTDITFACENYWEVDFSICNYFVGPNVVGGVPTENGREEDDVCWFFSSGKK